MKGAVEKPKKKIDGEACEKPSECSNQTGCEVKTILREKQFAIVKQIKHVHLESIKKLTKFDLYQR